MKYDARHGFLVLVLVTNVFFFTLFVWGMITTRRPRVPTVSQLIDDYMGQLLLFTLSAGIFVVSRTGLVFRSTFFKLSPTYEVLTTKNKDGEKIMKPGQSYWEMVKGVIPGFRGFVRSQSFPKFTAFFGSVQLVCIILVAVFGLIEYPEIHFASATCIAVFGSLCELFLLARRYEAGWDHMGLWHFFINSFLLFVMIICFIVFGISTMLDYHAAINTYVGSAEWIAFAVMIQIGVFRVFDVERICRSTCNECSCDKA